MGPRSSARKLRTYFIAICNPNPDQRMQMLPPPPPQLNKMISEVLVVRLQGTRLMVLHVQAKREKGPASILRRPQCPVEKPRTLG